MIILENPVYYFSYWIILWFILYYFKIIKFNPKIFILFGIIENIGSFILIYSELSTHLKKNYKKLTIPMINFIFKLYVFYYLRNTSYKMDDFIAGVILYLIYNVSLKIFFNKNILEFYNSKNKRF